MGRREQGKRQAPEKVRGGGLVEVGGCFEEETHRVWNVEVAQARSVACVSTAGVE